MKPMNMITKIDFKHYFKQWKNRMKRCSDTGGEYIEGDRKIYTKSSVFFQSHFLLVGEQFQPVNCKGFQIYSLAISLIVPNIIIINIYDVTKVYRVFIKINTYTFKNDFLTKFPTIFTSVYTTIGLCWVTSWGLSAPNF